MIEDFEGDPAVAYRETERKARKFWTCVECRSDIVPGELYVEISGVWLDGGPQRFRMCRSCRRWAESALYALKLESYILGALAETIAELTLRGRSEDGAPIYFVDRRRV